jgi:hypothetical protein
MLAHRPEILTEAGTAARAMPAFTFSTLESFDQSVTLRTARRSSAGDQTGDHPRKDRR